MIRSLRREANQTADGEAAPPADAHLRRQKIVQRLAQRSLAEFRKGERAPTVRGGLFGFNNTFHELEVYELLAERLLAEEIEINVYRIAGKMGTGNTPVLDAHVVSVARERGWPKYLRHNPVSEPEAFATLSVSAPYTVTQIYPPPPEPSDGGSVY